MSEDIIVLNFPDNLLINFLLGEGDRNLSRIEASLSVSISVRGNNFFISGSKANVSMARNVLEKIYNDLGRNNRLSENDIENLIRYVQTAEGEVEERASFLRTRKRNIVPYTKSQKRYIDILSNKDIVFAYGPAGTGKTYLAVAYAVSVFLERKVDRIILSRPAVEAGEKIGFLPGDIKDKIDPYLRPLYDALYDMIQPEIVHRLIENNEIEIAPLAFMRGRTLNNAFIILDEAQNTTPLQMKMFLTRMGNGSKMVITGDPTQTDLPKDVDSGLKDAIKKLKSIEELGFAEFGEKDIVRHPLTAKIIEAYEAKKKI